MLFLASQTDCGKAQRGTQEGLDAKMRKCQATGRSRGFRQEAGDMVENLPLACHWTSSVPAWWLRLLLYEMEPLGAIFYKWLPTSQSWLQLSERLCGISSESYTVPLPD